MSPCLNLGIIGCGRVTEMHHWPAISGLSGQLRVVAVADPDESKAGKLASVMGASCIATDVSGILRETRERLDAIAVLTPPSEHADIVEMALDAGKHVFLEKPISLTLSDADRIVTATAKHAAQVLVVGFQLRQHRLIREIAKLVREGMIGEVRLIRTFWTCSLRGRLDIPSWRNRRITGGGVLTELAVHHFDLVRHLTGLEVTEALAVSEHGEGDDEAASVTLRLSNGAIAACVFTEHGGDAQEVELIGSRGRLGCSLYRFDSLVFTPTGCVNGRAWQWTQTMKEFPRVLPVLRRGGDLVESYRQEWLAFCDAISGRGLWNATAEDGREALRVVLASQASANLGRSVPVSMAPPAPPKVPGRVEYSGNLDREAQSVEVARSSASEISAIIVTRRDFGAIRRTVGYLRQQTISTRMEIVVVCPSLGELGLTPSDSEGFHEFQVVEIGTITSIGSANAAGVRAAKSPIVVLCEDHAFPDQSWAEELVRAHRVPCVVVGPAVYNANPGTMVSWADCLIGYGPWLQPIPAMPPTHLPGHNSSYKRAILLMYGSRLEAMLEAETILHWDLSRRGGQLVLEPRARLAHTNFALWGMWTRVQFHAGRMFGATRAGSWPRWKRWIYALASPLIPMVRLSRTWTHARRLNEAHHFLPKVLPALVWGLLIDGLGQMVGYSLGVGLSREKLCEYEFERVRYITEQDRSALEKSDKP
jgi:myo-inositol 2-dehydrogenase/D-chiro-inositol 1-dehydrogenase